MRLVNFNSDDFVNSNIPRNEKLFSPIFAQRIYQLFCDAHEKMGYSKQIIIEKARLMWIKAQIESLPAPAVLSREEDDIEAISKIRFFIIGLCANREAMNAIADSSQGKILRDTFEKCLIACVAYIDSSYPWIHAKEMRDAAFNDLKTNSTKLCGELANVQSVDATDFLQTKLKLSGDVYFFTQEIASELYKIIQCGCQKDLGLNERYLPKLCDQFKRMIETAKYESSIYYTIFSEIHAVCNVLDSVAYPVPVYKAFQKVHTLLQNYIQAVCFVDHLISEQRCSADSLLSNFKIDSHLSSQLVSVEKWVDEFQKMPSVRVEFSVDHSAYRKLIFTEEFLWKILAILVNAQSAMGFSLQIVKHREIYERIKLTMKSVDSGERLASFFNQLDFFISTLNDSDVTPLSDALKKIKTLCAHYVSIVYPGLSTSSVVVHPQPQLLELNSEPLYIFDYLNFSATPYDNFYFNSIFSNYVIRKLTDMVDEAGLYHEHSESLLQNFNNFKCSISDKSFISIDNNKYDNLLKSFFLFGNNFILSSDPHIKEKNIKQLTEIHQAIISYVQCKNPAIITKYMQTINSLTDDREKLSKEQCRKLSWMCLCGLNGMLQLPCNILWPMFGWLSCGYVFYYGKINNHAMISFDYDQKDEALSTAVFAPCERSVIRSNPSFDCSSQFLKVFFCRPWSLFFAARQQYHEAGEEKARLDKSIENLTPLFMR